MQFEISFIEIEIEIKKRYRFGVTINDQFKPLFWVEVSKDRSVYVAPRMQKITQIRKSKSVGLSGTIEIKDITKLPKEISDSSHKFSFHKSGINKGFGDYYKSVCLEESAKRHLCSLYIPNVNKVKLDLFRPKSDIELKLKNLEDKGLWAHFHFISTRDQYEIPFWGAEFQVHYRLKFSEQKILHIIVYPIKKNQDIEDDAIFCIPRNNNSA